MNAKSSINRYTASAAATNSALPEEAAAGMKHVKMGGGGTKLLSLIYFVYGVRFHINYNF